LLLASYWIPAWFTLDPEDGCRMFLGNVGDLPDSTAPHPMVTAVRISNPAYFLSNLVKILESVYYIQIFIYGHN
jgi:hypothetical protein